MVLTRSSYSRYLARGAALFVLAAGQVTAIPLSPAAASTSIRSLFPPAAAYPPRAQLQPAVVQTHLDALVDPDTAHEVAHYGFVTGGVQVVSLPTGGTVTVTVVAVRTPRNAERLLRSFRAYALSAPGTPGVPVRGLGAGARYITGPCANCTQPTPLGILLLRRDAALVQIVVEPPNRALALRLGSATTPR